MNRQTAVVTVLCLVAAMGCQRKAKPELSAVPPPVDPVSVQGYNTPPVAPQPVAWEAQPAYAAPAPTPVPMPAGPPPTTSTSRGLSAGLRSPYCSSRPVSGCWMQLIG